MRLVAWTWFACVSFWTLFGACVDTPPATAGPVARLVAVWDPTACTDPHRVALELTDDDGLELSRSAPCAIGSVSIDVPHLGPYHGRVFGWVLGGAIRNASESDIDVADSITRWELPSTP